MIEPFIGGVRFMREIRIDASNMKDWPAERITQFFDGLAKAIRAYCDEPPLLLTYRPDLPVK